MGLNLLSRMLTAGRKQIERPLTYEVSKAAEVNYILDDKKCYSLVLGIIAQLALW